jgi:hypothetical protein
MKAYQGIVGITPLILNKIANVSNGATGRFSPWGWPQTQVGIFGREKKIF